MKKTVIIIIVIVILGLVFLSTREGPTPQEDSYNLWKQQPNKKIVFLSKADSQEGELYLLDNTGEKTRLTNNERHEANPAFSPEGKKVAFHAGNENDPQSWDLYILNLETGEETRLTNNNLLDGHPDWSPDGSRIIFTSFRDSQGNPSSTSDIYVINTDGTRLNRLTSSKWDDADAEWSPDGSKIVFKSTRNTQKRYREEIYVMDNDGSNVRRLTTTSDNMSDHDPSWSPDSKTIVFNRYEGSRLWIEITELDIMQNYWQELTPWSIYKTDLRGNVMKLTDAKYIDGLPVFSADGNKVLFIKQDFILNDDNQLVGSHGRFTLMDTDGMDQKQLIPDDKHTPTLEYFDWVKGEVGDENGDSEQKGENFTGELNPVWVKTWGGSGDDHIFDVLVGKNQIFVTGKDESEGNDDLIVRRLDLDGDLIWEDSWDNGNSDVGFVMTKNDGYIYVGGKTGEGGGSEDALILKYDLDGALVWKDSWGTEDYEEVDGLTIQGNTLYAYIWTGPIAGDVNVGILRYSLNGDLLGSSTWEVEGRNEANGHIYSDSTGIYGAGGAYSGKTIFSEADAFLAKFNPDGNYLWHKTWGGEKSDDAWNLTSDGEYLYVTGMTKSYGEGNYDVFVLKYTMDGELIWGRTWGGSQRDVARGITVDDNHVWISVKTKSYGNGGWDLALLKYQKDGNLLGYKLWGDSGDDEQHSLKVDSSHIYIAGETSSFGAVGKDAFLMKIKK